MGYFNLVGKGVGSVSTLTDLIPSVTNTYDLGTTSLRWRNLFISGTATLGDTGGSQVHLANGAAIRGNAGATTNFNLEVNGSTALIRLQGGSAGGTDARIDVYGSSHGSRPNNIEMFQGANQVFDIDAAGLISLGLSGGTQAHVTNGAMVHTRFITTQRFDVASTATITALDSTRSFVRITGSTITAIQGITAGVDGQRLTVFNNAGVAVTFAHENAGASAANRITSMTGADAATVGNGAAELIYDTGTSRWILLYVTA